MKHLAYIILFLLFSCTSRHDKSSRLSKTIDTANSESNEVSNDWLNNYPDLLVGLMSSFYKLDLSEYSCEFISPIVADMEDDYKIEKLVQIDSLLANKIFEAKLPEIPYLLDSYLFSIEKPIQGFYPITIINPYGVVERPMILILFNSNGEYVNFIEVADLYGETGGCLSSKFINDSTMIRNYEWYEYVIDSLGNENDEIEYATQEVVISNNGKIELKELKRCK